MFPILKRNPHKNWDTTQLAHIDEHVLPRLMEHGRRLAAPRADPSALHRVRQPRYTSPIGQALHGD